MQSRFTKIPPVVVLNHPGNQSTYGFLKLLYYAARYGSYLASGAECALLSISFLFI